MRTAGPWLWTVAGVVVALAGGCQGGGDSVAVLTPGGDAGAAPARGDAIDPVERSRLREAAIASLLGLAASDDAQVRANAVEGLIPVPARLGPVLASALADENEGVRAVAAMAVGKCGLAEMSAAVHPLLRDPSPYVRAGAIFALRSCGEGVDPTPLGGLATAHPSPRVRSYASYILGELGDDGTSALLRDAANQQMPRVSTVEMKVLQVQIAEALVKLGDAEQLHTIRAALYPSTPEELDATVLAVQILGSQRDRPSEGQLRNLSRMRDPEGKLMPIEVRLAVAGALGALGSSELEPLAAETLAAGDEPQRIQAAWALGEIGTPSAVRALEGALGEPGERVRVAVGAALLRAVEPGSRGR